MNIKNTKKSTVEQLHKILNNDSKKDLSSNEEKVFKSLTLRLKSSNKEILLKPKVVKVMQEKDFDYLKPKINIHIREKKKDVFVKYKKEKPKEKLYEKDLLEVEKVDVIEPRFIEVKPKVITKLKKEKLSEVELVEWEEVNIKSTETEKLKDEISEKVTTEPVEFIEKIDEEIIEETKYKKDIEPSSTFGRFRNRRKKKESKDLESVEFEELEEEKEDIGFEKLSEAQETPFEKEFKEEDIELDFTKKIETFRDYQSINEETAIILYNNGYTTTELLRGASLKDLKKIKGIKRKTAKKIKKEIDSKIEEELIAKPIEVWEIPESEIKEEKHEDLEERKEELCEPIEKDIKYIEMEPVEEIQLEKELPIKVEESIEEQNKKIEAFKDYKSINQETAVLLYDNGYTTTEFLKDANLKDLKKIKGIKRKTAKKIKKEIDSKIEEEELSIFEGEEEVFKDIKSINRKIAKLLLENGVNSIDLLKKMTIKDLTNIRGVRKKIAKKIKKEITLLSETTEKQKIPKSVKPKKQIAKKHKKTKIPLKKKISKKDKKEITKLQEITKKPTITKSLKPKKQIAKKHKKTKTAVKKKISKNGKKESKGVKRKGYTLYEKKIKTKSGKKTTLRFFSKEKPKGAKPIEIPKNFKILINKKTGVPYLKKKK